MLLVAKSMAELKKRFPDSTIHEQGNCYFVFTKTGIVRFLKPRTREEIADRLLNGRFPKKYVDAVFGEKERTDAVKAVLSSKKGVFLSGKAGTGKTFACILKIALLVKLYKVNLPLFMPLQNLGDVFEYKKLIWEYDSFLVDDLNPNLGEWERKLVIETIYHAYNENKLLFVTSNAGFKTVAHFLKEEPLVSRLLEMCEVRTVKGEDLRVKRRP
ncbi:DNA replication protein DnaC [Balnearium lithotrophicum]|uniref:DNA replication protein DnaC n=1 Tax=Balnearium lithotrophicum TaxID=223788 RepID=A0A521DZV4_9BACT|nr:ATP-binding protein [Balnearium lithotrophicum]SMO77236.1 DNA replication protein DnaC [Balnearium lithotrophicum]